MCIFVIHTVSLRLQHHTHMTRARYHCVYSLHIENHSSTHDGNDGDNNVCDGGDDDNSKWIRHRWAMSASHNNFFSIYLHQFFVLLLAFSFTRTPTKQQTVLYHPLCVAVCNQHSTEELLDARHTTSKAFIFFYNNFSLSLIFIFVCAELLLLITPFLLWFVVVVVVGSFLPCLCTARTTWALIFALYFLAFCVLVCVFSMQNCYGAGKNKQRQHEK